MKYLLRIKPAGKVSQLIVSTLLRQIPSLSEKQAARLLQEGGIVAQNLSRQTANKLAALLLRAGLEVEVQPMKGEEPARPHPDPKPDPKPDPAPAPAPDPVPRPSLPDGEDGWVVHGRVHGAGDSPAAGVVVRAFDRDLRREVLLGETISGPKGDYLIEYFRKGFEQAESGSPDLVLRLYDRTGRELDAEFDREMVLLGDSLILFNAGPNEQIQVRLTAGEGEVSRYEELIMALEPLLDGVLLSELTREDVRFLHHETLYEVHEIDFIKEDARLCRQTSMPGGVFYGLAMQGIGAIPPQQGETENASQHRIELSEVLAEPMEERMARLEKAISGRLVPVSFREQLEQIRERFEQLVEESPRETESERKERIRFLGNISGLSKEDTERLSEKLPGGEIPEEKWEQLIREKTLSGESAERAKVTFELDQITAHNRELTALLHRLPVSPKERVVTSSRELAWMNAVEWEEVLEENRIPVPEGLERKEYARRLSGELERRHPTEAFFRRTVRERRKLADELEVIDALPVSEKTGFRKLAETPGIPVREGHEGVEKELTAFARTFRHLGVAEIFDDPELEPAAKTEAVQGRLLNLQAFFEENPEMDLRTVKLAGPDPDLQGEAESQPEVTVSFETVEPELREKVRKQVLAYQRTYNLAGDVEGSRMLLSQGFDSAHRLAVSTPEQVSHLTGLTLEEVRPLFLKATVLADVADHLAGTLVPYLPGTNVSAEAEGASDIQMGNVLREMDGYEDLFGSLSYCRCEHCRSIFGPAAYFVDLMRFIEERIRRPLFRQEGHLLDLRIRRPDLWSLPLTCENTKKLVPNLMLVNEILSRYLSEVEGLFSNGESPTPREIESALFDRLRQTDRSLVQPLNIPLEELKIYLSHFDLPLHQVVETVAGAGEKSLLSRFELSVEELSVITTPQEQTAVILRRFGLEPNVTPEEIPLQGLLRATGLQRKELDRVVGLSFVNGSGVRQLAVEQRQKQGEVQPVEEFLIHGSAGHLDRLHRFLRLWRATNWSLEELDYLLEMGMRLGISEKLDRRMLLFLAGTWYLQDQLGLSVSQLSAMMDRIPDQPLESGKTSLLERLFHATPFVKQQPNFFQLQAPYRFWYPPFEEGESFKGETDPEQPRLLGALGLSQTEFSRLMQQLRSALNPEVVQMQVDGEHVERTCIELNPKNLTLLYRHALLCRALGLTVPELFALLKLAGQQEGLLSDGPAGLLSLLSFREAFLGTAPGFEELVRFVRPEGSSGTEEPDPGRLVELKKQVREEVILTRGEMKGLSSRLGSRQIADLQKVLHRAGILVRLPNGQNGSNGEQYHLSDSFDAGEQQTLASPLSEFLEMEGLLETSLPTAGAGQNGEGESELEPLTLGEWTGRVLESIRHYLPEEQFSVRFAEELSLTQRELSLLVQLLSGTDTPDEAAFRRSFVLDELFPEERGADESESDLPAEVMRLAELKDSLGLREQELRFIAGERAFFCSPDGMQDGGMRSPDRRLAFVRRSLLYRRLLDSFPQEQDALNHLIALMAAGADFSSGDSNKEAAEFLSKVTETDPEHASTLLEILEKNEGQEEQLEFLKRLLRAFSLADRLGMNGHSLARVAANDYDELELARDSVAGAIRTTAGSEEAYQEVIESLEERVLELKRDVLADDLCSRPDLGFSDIDSIYNYFLIDPGMAGCGRTSRVVEATASLQLYVNRCLMNLEQGEEFHVLPEMIPAREWEWRKNYRVWEANRKVFLYPENFLRPELRDDKTPPFEVFEKRLHEEDLNNQAVEKIYMEYLDAFEEISTLRVAGSYFEPFLEGGDQGVLYIVGRTRTEPVCHYLRIRNGQNWSAWEKVDAEIAGKAVSPIVYKNRLYLFWVETEAENKYKSGKRPGERDSVFAGYIHTIRLKYVTRQAGGGWSTPQSVSLPDEIGKVEDPLEDRARYSHQRPGTWIAPIYTPKYQRAENPAHYEYDDGQGLSGPDRYVPAPLKEYRLDAPQFNRIFAFVSRERLCFAYGESELVYELKFPSGKVVPAQGNPKQAFTGVPAFYLSIDSRQRDRPELREGRQTNLFYIDFTSFENHYYRQAELLFEKELEQAGSVRISAGVVPADAEVLPVNNNPRLWILEHEKGTGLLEQTRRQEVHLHRLDTATAGDLKTVLFGEGLETMLSLENQANLTEREIITGSSGIFLYKTFARTSPFPLVGYTSEIYLWEIFFHAPMTIAERFKEQGKHEEAERWYRFIFDPTAGEVPNADPKVKLYFPLDRNWRFYEFHRAGIPRLNEILNSAAPAYQAYLKDPFNPHAVARSRISAYQKRIVMSYLENLFNWGDQLFSLDTRESIGEAVLVYLIAGQILGRRPAEAGACDLPPEGQMSFEELDVTDAFIVTLENMVLSGNGSRFNLSYLLAGNGAGAPPLAKQVAPWPGKFTGRLAPVTFDQPIFCVPRNEDLMGYWDLLTDRLFKIRHCMDIEGVRRSLSLFQPPIDPALLVRAAAAGLSPEDLLGLSSPGVPAYRFGLLLGKAKEYCSTVRSFGSALLSALERKDGEELQLLRSIHVQNIQKMNTRIYEQKVEIAQEAVASLEARRELLEFRRDHYASRERMNSTEATSAILSAGALTTHAAAGALSAVAASAMKMPVFQAGISGLGPHAVTEYGGSNIGGSLNSWAQVMRDVSSGLNMGSGMAAVQGSFDRRQEEWNFQQDLAQRELNQLERELIGAELRLEIAGHSLKVHREQIEQSGELHDFYRQKFTGLGLYSWMAGELRKLYRQAYRNALDLARMAEEAYRYEKDDESIFIEAGSWESPKAGLLAGERLQLQLQEMERTYLENNSQVLEVDQTFSLSRINPTALETLRQKGECHFSIPEFFFDLVYPGHYKRRILSVRVTIPCVTGPYVNINAKLTLIRSFFRRKAESGEQHLVEEPRSRNRSIATSRAQNDAGVFDLVFQEGRYRPFEGAGAVSEWKLELPDTFRSFDYDSISDLLLHIGYSAQEDGLYRSKVEEGLHEIYNSLAQTTGIQRVIPLAEEFGNEFRGLFRGLEGSETENQQIRFRLDERQFPHFLKGRLLELRQAGARLKLREPWLSIAQEQGITLDPVGVMLEIEDSDSHVGLSVSSQFTSPPDTVGHPEAGFELEGNRVNIGRSGVGVSLLINQSQLIAFCEELAGGREEALPVSPAGKADLLDEVLEDILFMAGVSIAD